VTQKHDIEGLVLGVNESASTASHVGSEDTPDRAC
jgi:hypothetical protein